MSKKEYYITKEGIGNLRQEYQTLKEIEWPLVVKRVAEARELGKLEDNQEFDEAKKAKDIIERKIAELEEILENAVELKRQKSSSEAFVSVGSTLTVEVQGTRQTFTIVGSIEADPSQGKISDESPVGRELLGLKEGDVVTVTLPHASIDYRIKKIHR